MIINSEPDMIVIDAAATGDEAVARYRQHSPDITLMDLQLPDMGGVDAIRAIRELDPNARIIVLTMYKGDEDIHRAIDAGASTYLLKDTLADDLPRIVREVHAGRRTLPPDVQARLQERAVVADADAARSRGDGAGGRRAARQGDRRGAVDQQSDRAGAHEEHLRQAGRRRPHRGDERGDPPRHHSHRLSPVNRQLVHWERGNRLAGGMPHAGVLVSVPFQPMATPVWTAP